MGPSGTGEGTTGVGVGPGAASRSVCRGCRASEGGRAGSCECEVGAASTFARLNRPIAGGRGGRARKIIFRITTAIIVTTSTKATATTTTVTPEEKAHHIYVPPEVRFWWKYTDTLWWRVCASNIQQQHPTWTQRHERETKLQAVEHKTVSTHKTWGKNTNTPSASRLVSCFQVLLRPFA